VATLALQLRAERTTAAAMAAETELALSSSEAAMAAVVAALESLRRSCSSVAARAASATRSAFKAAAAVEKARAETVRQRGLKEEAVAGARKWEELAAQAEKRSSKMAAERRVLRRAARQLTVQLSRARAELVLLARAAPPGGAIDADGGKGDPSATITKEERLAAVEALLAAARLGRVRTAAAAERVKKATSEAETARAATAGTGITGRGGTQGAGPGAMDAFLEALRGSGAASPTATEPDQDGNTADLAEAALWSASRGPEQVDTQLAAADVGGLASVQQLPQGSSARMYQDGDIGDDVAKVQAAGLGAMAVNASDIASASTAVAQSVSLAPATAVGLTGEDNKVDDDSLSRLEGEAVSLAAPPEVEAAGCFCWPGSRASSRPNSARPSSARPGSGGPGSFRSGQSRASSKRGMSPHQSPQLTTNSVPVHSISEDPLQAQVQADDTTATLTRTVISTTESSQKAMTADMSAPAHDSSQAATTAFSSFGQDPGDKRGTAEATSPGIIIGGKLQEQEIEIDKVVASPATSDAKSTDAAQDGPPLNSVQVRETSRVPLSPAVSQAQEQPDNIPDHALDLQQSGAAAPEMLASTMVDEKRSDAEAASAPLEKKEKEQTVAAVIGAEAVIAQDVKLHGADAGSESSFSSYASSSANVHDDGATEKAHEEATAQAGKGLWRKAQSGDGGVYYFHSGTFATQWPRPADYDSDADAAAWAAEQADDGDGDCDGKGSATTLEESAKLLSQREETRDAVEKAKDSTSGSQPTAATGEVAGIRVSEPDPGRGVPAQGAEGNSAVSTDPGGRTASGGGPVSFKAAAPSSPPALSESGGLVPHPPLPHVPRPVSARPGSASVR
jgi:hypothetical protein